MAKPERVAFLGLGIMGAPMAANLVKAGFEVIVWNRTQAKATDFAGTYGAHPAPTPAAAAEAADVTITMVPDGPQVEEVLFGDNGAAEGMRRGALAIDMSTIAPAASVSIGERLGDEGVGFLDAPVTGSRPKAEDGTLPIMGGGGETDFARGKTVPGGGGGGARFGAGKADPGGDGAARGPRRAAGPRVDREAPQQHDGRGERAPGRGGAGGGEGRGRRHREASSGDGGRLGRLHHARAQGRTDARARLH